MCLGKTSSWKLTTNRSSIYTIYARTSKTSERIERWVLRLQAYELKVVYRSGKTNIADVLSRLNSRKPTIETDKYDCARRIAINVTSIALTTKELEQESENNQKLEEIRNYVKSGDWSKSEQF